MKLDGHRTARSIAVLAFSLAAVPLFGQTAAPAAAGRGKAVYERSGCASCHGPAARGAGAAALVPMTHQLPAFLRLVRQPSNGVMPALTVAAASDADVADLFAYLRSMSPAASATPTGDAVAGKKLFAAAGCYACHGYVGQGGSAGPRLGPPAISFAAFERELRHPRDEMPPYTPKSLSDQQLADLYAFVKTFPEPPDVNSISILKPPVRKQ